MTVCEGRDELRRRAGGRPGERVAVARPVLRSPAVRLGRDGAGPQMIGFPPVTATVAPDT